MSEFDTACSILLMSHRADLPLWPRVEAIIEKFYELLITKQLVPGPMPSQRFDAVGAVPVALCV
jgi:hypothetical protein